MHFNHTNHINLGNCTDIFFDVKSKRDANDPMLFHYSVTLDNGNDVEFQVTFSYHAINETISNLSSTLDSEIAYSASAAMMIAAQAITASIEQVIVCDEKTIGEVEPYFYCDEFENHLDGVKIYMKTK